VHVTEAGIPAACERVRGRRQKGREAGQQHIGQEDFKKRGWLLLDDFVHYLP
jgi:hypothetical protein